MIRLDRIKKALAKPPRIEVVSLDVFDTLLDRLIPSTRVAQLSAEYLAARLPGANDPAAILRSRLHYKQTKEAAGKEWIVADWLSGWAKANDYDPAFVRRAGRDAELAAETISLRLTNETKETFRWLKEQELTLIAVSDMWLESEWLQALLRSFDLHFHAVFSSGSLEASKRQGTIFAPLQNRLALPASAFLHLGDNLNNDFLKPRRAGWNAAWIPQQRHRFPPRVPLKLQRGPLKPSGASEILRLLELEPMDRREDVFANRVRILGAAPNPFLYCPVAHLPRAEDRRRALHRSGRLADAQGVRHNRRPAPRQLSALLPESLPPQHRPLPPG